MIQSLLKYVLTSVAVLFGIYAGFLGLLTASFFQANAVYLHKIQMTWFKDLNVPESFGFLRGQTTAFSIKSPDGGMLFAWHILPIELYREHESSLVKESPGFTSDVTTRHAFKLLRHDPDARLVIHMHGAGGTVGSGYRVPNYRALSAGQPRSIHVLTFDYRGFGYSPGVPNEQGVRLDAIAVAKWAMEVAGVHPSQILIFSQSLGTAVGLAVAEHFALQSPPVLFAGNILVAPFVDTPTLVATYRIAGSIPLLSPLARFPVLFKYLSFFLIDTWSSKDRIANLIRTNEANGQKYQLTLIHAEDDYDVPWHHTEKLYWHAINATSSGGVTYDELDKIKNGTRNDLGAGGTVMEWRTRHGILREELLKTGLHDVIMGNPVITMAVMRIFTATDPSYG